MPHYEVQMESSFTIHVEADSVEGASVKAQRGDGQISRTKTSVDVYGPYGNDTLILEDFRVITQGEEV